MMIGDSCFSDILNLLRHEVVGLARNTYGNHGDGMIERGTIELFHRYQIRHRLLTRRELMAKNAPEGITLIAEAGGGNLGTFYRGSPKRRCVLARMPLPKIILPQSVLDANEDLSAFRTVYVREQASLEILQQYHTDVRLAPDMALALRLTPSVPNESEGVFLRADREAHGERGNDPVKLVANTEEYLKLAGRWRAITTNRLHFAIAAILQNRSVTLKPNSYHKNRSMYDTWLRRFDNVTFAD